MHGPLLQKIAIHEQKDKNLNRELQGFQMKHQMVLLSSRVKADKIQAAGYEFKYPELDTAVQHLIQENL